MWLWPYLLPFSRYWCLKLEDGWIFPPHPCSRLLLGGNPLECRDEIWHQKTRIMGLPEGGEIMTLPFFVLTQYRRVTDRRTDTLFSRKTRASIASHGWKSCQLHFLNASHPYSSTCSFILWNLETRDAQHNILCNVKEINAYEVFEVMGVDHRGDRGRPTLFEKCMILPPTLDCTCVNF